LQKNFLSLYCDGGVNSNKLNSCAIKNSLKTRNIIFPTGINVKFSEIIFAVKIVEKEKKIFTAVFAEKNFNMISRKFLMSRIKMVETNDSSVYNIEPGSQQRSKPKDPTELVVGLSTDGAEVTADTGAGGSYDGYSNTSGRLVLNEILI
jgi:hypothetical protein